MLTANKSLQFTQSNLINFNTNTVNLDDKNVLDRVESHVEDTPDAVLDRLVLGNQQYVELRAKQLHRNDSIRLAGAAQGHTPFAAVLNYAKLSAPIEEIFDRKFGELFTIDSSVQTTTRKEISAIEYGILVLGIKVVIVLIDAPKKSETTTRQPFKLEIEHNKILVSALATAEHEDPSKMTDPDPSTNTTDRVNKLKTSKLLSQFVSAGSLKIVGGLYDIESCGVTIDS